MTLLSSNLVGVLNCFLGFTGRKLSFSSVLAGMLVKLNFFGVFCNIFQGQF